MPAKRNPKKGKGKSLFTEQKEKTKSVKQLEKEKKEREGKEEKEEKEAKEEKEEKKLSEQDIQDIQFKEKVLKFRRSDDPRETLRNANKLIKETSYAQLSRLGMLTSFRNKMRDTILKDTGVKYSGTSAGGLRLYHSGNKNKLVDDDYIDEEYVPPKVSFSIGKKPAITKEPLISKKGYIKTPEEAARLKEVGPATRMEIQEKLKKGYDLSTEEKRKQYEEDLEKYKKSLKAEDKASERGELPYYKRAALEFEKTDQLQKDKKIMKKILEGKDPAMSIEQTSRVARLMKEMEKEERKEKRIKEFMERRAEKKEETPEYGEEKEKFQKWMEKQEDEALEKLERKNLVREVFENILGEKKDVLSRLPEKQRSIIEEQQKRKRSSTALGVPGTDLVVQDILDSYMNLRKLSEEKEEKEKEGKEEKEEKEKEGEEEKEEKRAKRIREIKESIEKRAQRIEEIKENMERRAGTGEQKKEEKQVIDERILGMIEQKKEEDPIVEAFLEYYDKIHGTGEVKEEDPVVEAFLEYYDKIYGTGEVKEVEEKYGTEEVKEVEEKYGTEEVKEVEEKYGTEEVQGYVTDDPAFGLGIEEVAGMEEYGLDIKHDPEEAQRYLEIRRPPPFNPDFIDDRSVGLQESKYDSNIRFHDLLYDDISATERKQDRREIKGDDGREIKISTERRAGPSIVREIDDDLVNEKVEGFVKNSIDQFQRAYDKARKAGLFKRELKEDQSDILDRQNGSTWDRFINDYFEPMRRDEQRSYFSRSIQQYMQDNNIRNRKLKLNELGWDAMRGLAEDLGVVSNRQDSWSSRYGIDIEAFEQLRQLGAIDKVLSHPRVQNTAMGRALDELNRQTRAGSKTIKLGKDLELKVGSDGYLTNIGKKFMDIMGAIAVPVEIAAGDIDVAKHIKDLGKGFKSARDIFRGGKRIYEAAKTKPEEEGKQSGDGDVEVKDESESESLIKKLKEMGAFGDDKAKGGRYPETKQIKPYRFPGPYESWNGVELIQNAQTGYMNSLNMFGTYYGDSTI